VSGTAQLEAACGGRGSRGSAFSHHLRSGASRSTTPNGGPYVFHADMDLQPPYPKGHGVDAGLQLLDSRFAVRRGLPWRGGWMDCSGSRPRPSQRTVDAVTKLTPVAVDSRNAWSIFGPVGDKDAVAR
jgi:hypothetical protein